MPNSKSSVSKILTQVVETIQARVNFNIAQKSGAQAAEIRVQNGNHTEQIYTLHGDRYTLGRSSSCDITIDNELVSGEHCSLTRNKKKPRSFIAKDEGSSNGIYRRKKRLKSLSLFHGESFILSPPELEKSVKITFLNPPPAWIKIIRYSLYGTTGLLGLVLLSLGIEWSKTSIYPLPRESTRPIVVYAEDGKTTINPVYSDTHRELKHLRNFSSYLPQAVVASEDSRFYWHLGVDPYGIARAVVTNIRSSRLREGASTLTQQLARSLFPEVGRDNTAGRKVREMIVAFKLEAFYSKDDILKAYLNRVYLGIGLYGFEDAARFYFSKSAADLDLSEAATLAAILPAPNAYNPVKDYDTAVGLRNRIINRMQKMGMVSEAEADRARRSRIEVSPKAKSTFSQAIAPYFYSYVLKELEGLLGKDVAQEGNFIVETALDPKMQKSAELSLQNSIREDGAKVGFSQGALVSLDTETGGIKALVGGFDHKQSQFNRVTQAQRQPGSTFKLFTYAAAIESGVSTKKKYSCDPVLWKGQKYRGCERSEGKIDMSKGLAQSENAIALRIAQDAGLNRVSDVAKRLGIQSSLSLAPGLVLGHSEVNVLELTGSYGAIANKGTWNRPHGIKRILDSSECEDLQDLSTCREIYNFANQAENQREAIEPRVARTMTKLLRQAVKVGTGRAAKLGEGEAGKTGTTDDNVDLWFIGYVPEIDVVTGIWLGNDDNSPTNGSSWQAATLWGRYMQEFTD